MKIDGRTTKRDGYHDANDHSTEVVSERHNPLQWGQLNIDGIGARRVILPGMAC